MKVKGKKTKFVAVSIPATTKARLEAYCKRLMDLETALYGKKCRYIGVGAGIENLLEAGERILSHREFVLNQPEPMPDLLKKIYH